MSKKIGTRNGIQRYKCNECGRKFSSKRRPKNLQEIIFKKYIYRRQILSNLAEDYNRSLPWIRKQILEYEPDEKIHNPREVVIVCDATFYGKRKDKLGTLVFKDTISKEILTWKHIDSELVFDYKQHLDLLVELGYKVQAIIIDGKRGLYKALKTIQFRCATFIKEKQSINI